MKIVLLERDSVGRDVAVDCYNEFGEVTVYPDKVSAAETMKRIGDADIVICNKSPINEESLKDCPNVKIVCELATGFDNCDLAYCKARGIKVANVRDYSTAMVAQHTLTLALAMSQKLSFYDEYVKSGQYAAQDSFSYFGEPFRELDGKTWGIIGMGNIGKRVAKMAEAFGCKVIFHSVTGRSTVTEYEQVDFDTLLSESDILSLHCPLTDITRDLIDAAALKKMKKTAILLNLARGPVVNNTDLYEALLAGEIQAAGLDVLEKEPITAENPLSKITDSRRLIITPHIGWASVEARTRCVEGVYLNIAAFLKGEDRNVVNA